MQGLWTADNKLEEVTWRQVERGLGLPLRRFAQDGAAVPDQDLAVRVTLEELREIWHRRLVVRNDVLHAVMVPCIRIGF